MTITSYTKKNGKKCFALDAYLGIHPATGRKVEISRRGFATEVDAMKEYIEAKAQYEALDMRGPILRKRFAEVYEKWLEVYRPSVRESTYHHTTCFFRLYVLPSFGEVYLDRLDIPTMQSAVIEWTEKSSKVKVIWRYVIRVLDYAVKFNYLKSHRAKEVEIPKNKDREAPAVSSQRFLEREELEEYLRSAEEHLEHRWYVLIRLLAMTGLRRGEALALTAADYKDGVVSVNKTLAMGIDHVQIVNPPKTAKGRRSVMLDALTRDLLDGLVVDLEPNEPIFQSRSGEYCSVSKVGHIMAQIEKRGGQPHITPHILRHTHCSLLFEAGAGIAEVQERLGHEDVKITLEIYNHVSAKKRTGAVDKLTAYLNF